MAAEEMKFNFAAAEGNNFHRYKLSEDSQNLIKVAYSRKVSSEARRRRATEFPSIGKGEREFFQ